MNMVKFIFIYEIHAMTHKPGSSIDYRVLVQSWQEKYVLYYEQYEADYM